MLKRGEKECGHQPVPVFAFHMLVTINKRGGKKEIKQEIISAETRVG